MFRIYKPFGYTGTGYGIEWFFLVFLLKNISGLKDGDMFKAQSSDVINYTEKYLDTFVIKNTDDNQINFEDNEFCTKIIESLLHDKNIINEIEVVDNLQGVARGEMTVFVDI